MEVKVYFYVLIIGFINLEVNAKNIIETNKDFDSENALEEHFFNRSQAEMSALEKIPTCLPNPCRNGGVCIENNGNNSCKCIGFYTGLLCEKNRCDCSGGYCEEEDGRIVCKCPRDWFKMSPTWCKRCDCGEGANCTFNRFDISEKLCICEEGYTDVDGYCKEKISTCLPNPCRNGGVCIENDGKMSCKCVGFYTGRLCEKNRCDCSGGYCEEEDGRIVCKCPRDWFKMSPTWCKRCDCGEGANCTFNRFDISEKLCICDEGYTDVDGYCKEKISTCLPNPCRNGGVCIENDGKMSCECVGFYTGRLCEKNRCDCSGGYCEEEDGRIVCKCPPDWFKMSPTWCKRCDCGEGANCTFNRFDISEKLCICKEGYTDVDGYCKEIIPRNLTTPGISTLQRNSSTAADRNTNTTDTTTVIPDSCFRYNCLNGGICIEKHNQPHCLCRLPYMGKFCEKDPCTENPCQNGGTCLLSGNSFKCICKEAFSGDNCESSTSNVRRIFMLVTVPVLIIIIIVLVTCLIIRSRRK